VKTLKWSSSVASENLTNNQQYLGNNARQQISLYYSLIRSPANIEFRVPYSQRYLFNAIPDINRNANPAGCTYRRLPKDTEGYRRLPKATDGYRRPMSVTSKLRKLCTLLYVTLCGTVILRFIQGGYTGWPS